MLTIIATIFVFGVIVLVHEWGHFITAKLTGMRVDEFAVGFGSKLWSKRVGETTYSLRSVPLGGFNRIAGMTEEQVEEDQVDPRRAFVYKPAWKRFIVIVAGAAMNFILAIILISGLFSAYGVSTPSDEPIVGEVLTQAPASSHQLAPGDRIVAIQGEPIRQWNEISPHMQKWGGQVVTLRVERNHKPLTLQVIPGSDNGRVVLGILPVIETRPVGLLESVQYGAERSWNLTVQMWKGIGQLITGKVSGSELAGPVGIAQMAGNIARTGFANLLMFTAVLSLNLGLLNLLPVPLLDGGHLLLIVVEGIIGKKLPPKYLYYIQMTGMLLLGALFIYATSNDILRFLK
ncbi:MAG: RIP metalloprotease RseP [Negativicoccus succinicivorans]|nr:RIP metalloprotease RseP [Negativicoccus succinicivorans]